MRKTWKYPFSNGFSILHFGRLFRTTPMDQAPNLLIEALGFQSNDILRFHSESQTILGMLLLSKPFNCFRKLLYQNGNEFFVFFYWSMLIRVSDRLHTNSIELCGFGRNVQYVFFVFFFCSLLISLLM